MKESFLFLKQLLLQMFVAELLIKSVLLEIS